MGFSQLYRCIPDNGWAGNSPDASQVLKESPGLWRWPPEPPPLPKPPSPEPPVKLRPGAPRLASQGIRIGPARLKAARGLNPVAPGVYFPPGVELSPPGRKGERQFGHRPVRTAAVAGGWMPVEAWAGRARAHSLIFRDHPEDLVFIDDQYLSCFVFHESIENHDKGVFPFGKNVTDSPIIGALILKVLII